MSDKKHIQEIDIIKGIAIILVVLGHCIEFGSGKSYIEQGLNWDNPVYKFIYGFHMPLFMLISGYLFPGSMDRYSIKELLIRKLRQCMIPIMTFTLIALLLSALRGNVLTIRSVLGMFSVTLWFLWAILLWSIAVIIVHNWLNDNILAYILIFVATMMVPKIGYSYLWMYMYPYFVVGYFAGKKPLARGKLGAVSLIGGVSIGCLILYLVLIHFWDSNVYIYNSYYCIIGNMPQQILLNLFRMITGFIGSAFVITSVITIRRIVSQGMVSKTLSFLGSNSMGIYVLSVYLNQWALRPITRNLNGLNYGICIVESVLMLMLCLGVIWIIKKNRITKLLVLGGR